MEHLDGHPHAFLDANNFVIDCLLFDSHDSPLLEQVKELRAANQVICCCDNGIAYVGGDFFEGKFYPPQTFPSWIRNTEDAAWQAPVPMPETVGAWEWNEDTLTWIEIPLLPVEETQIGDVQPTGE